MALGAPHAIPILVDGVGIGATSTPGGAVATPALDEQQASLGI
ncbi:MAG: hypothetical protein ABSF64_18590 [Bryobacteraceae bacterium]|jgi:hypothetical protein